MRCSSSPEAGTNKNLSTHLPQDGEPVSELAKEHGIGETTIPRWCKWEYHPALGRRLRHGIGCFDEPTRNGRKSGLVASRADVTNCVAAMRSPFYRRFRGNPGMWIATGIFRHDDGRLFFTQRYVYEHPERFGMPVNALERFIHTKQIEILEVVGPWRQARERWSVYVASEASLDCLVERREGRADGGRWLDANKIWRDAEGCWYSKWHIARVTGRPTWQVDQLLHAARRLGEVKRFKTAPRQDKPNFGRPLIVHHESDSRVRELLGIGGRPADQGNAFRTATREKPERLTPTRESILGALSRASKPLPGPELADKAGYDYGHIRNEVGPLLKQRLVCHTPGRGYELTPDGKRLVSDLTQL